jgi:hypothetical protein
LLAFPVHLRRWLSSIKSAPPIETQALIFERLADFRQALSSV